MKTPTNVLLITADQWRGECLSILGHPVVKTPNLDSLAQESVLFCNHYAQCTPCSPSRTSLYTGMYLMNHRSVRNGTPLDARFTNLALEMRKEGYEPGLIGYTDTTLDPRLLHPNDPARKRYTNVLPGFKELVPGSSGQLPWLRFLISKGYDFSLSLKDFFNHVDAYPGSENRGPTYPPSPYSSEDSDTAFMTNHAIEEISIIDKKPWFLHLSLLRPHPPFIVPEPYNTMYEPDEVPDFFRAKSPDEEAMIHPYSSYMLRHHLEKEGLEPKLHPNTENAMRQLRATYYGMITEVDDNIGRLIETLKKTGQFDNTLIVFTSDHGEQLWDHWMLGKECYFDQSFFIPLIIRVPGKCADSGRGIVVDAFSENIDIMPSILDLLDLDIPLQCDGHSLKPFLCGKNPDEWRQEVHWELDFSDVVNRKSEKELNLNFHSCSFAVIRDKHYKYVHFTALPALLFDIENDPYELNNLSTDPTYTETIAEYAKKMLSWRMGHADRTLTGILLDYERST